MNPGFFEPTQSPDLPGSNATELEWDDATFHANIESMIVSIRNVLARTLVNETLFNTAAPPLRRPNLVNVVNHGTANQHLQNAILAIIAKEEKDYQSRAPEFYREGSHPNYASVIPGMKLDLSIWEHIRDQGPNQLSEAQLQRMNHEHHTEQYKALVDQVYLRMDTITASPSQ